MALSVSMMARRSSMFIRLTGHSSPLLPDGAQELQRVEELRELTDLAILELEQADEAVRVGSGRVLELDADLPLGQHQFRVEHGVHLDTGVGELPIAGEKAAVDLVEGLLSPHFRGETLG